MAQNDFDPDAQENLSDAERAERDQLRTRVAQYFCERVKTDPAVVEVGPIASILGKWFEAERAQMLCKSPYKPYLKMLSLSTPLLSAKVIKLDISFPGATFSVIFAVYDDELLWLDDHTSNSEFDIFWQRENIRWQNEHEAATFMMETKFHYLPEPSRYMILNSVADIPQERFRAFLIEENALQELEDYNKKLTDVAQNIYPPSLVVDASGTHLQFCVYLKVGGRVLSINSDFDLDGHLTCKGEILADWVGEAFMPR